jgi:hypothetical protein
MAQMPQHSPMGSGFARAVQSVVYARQRGESLAQQQERAAAFGQQNAWPQVNIAATAAALAAAQLNGQGGVESVFQTQHGFASEQPGTGKSLLTVRVQFVGELDPLTGESPTSWRTVQTEVPLGATLSQARALAQEAVDDLAAAQGYGELGAYGELEAVSIIGIP